MPCEPELHVELVQGDVVRGGAAAVLLGRDQVQVEVHVHLEGLAHLCGGSWSLKGIQYLKKFIYVAGQPFGDEFSDTSLVLRSPERQVPNKTCCQFRAPCS